MTWRQQSLLIGSAAGGIAVAVALGATPLLGTLKAAAIGVPLGMALGGLAALASVFARMDPVTQRLASLREAGVNPAAPAPAPLGDHELDEAIAETHRALCVARRAQSVTAESEKTARALWAAVHGPPAAGQPFPEAAECLTDLFDLFRQNADSLRRYAASLGEANERMASGAVDQSETVARTATTVEALSEKIDRISRNAEDASEACDRARQEARRGLEQVTRVMEGMERLRGQIEVNGRKARRLGDRSVEIGTIVELIRGISGRTDMLALNATIESVRAGEHGRGFAVVAEEIRKLAERTATATRDIGTLVEAIQADTHESLRALGEEQTEMEQEAQRVREAGAALERISEVAELSAQLVDGISRSSNDQVLAAQDLVRAMQRITDVSHLTLERTNQSRESIRSLSQWCERLSPEAPVAPVSDEVPVAYPLSQSAVARRRTRPTQGVHIS